MVRVQLPDKNSAERKYAAEVLFMEILGLPITIEFTQYQHTIIKLENTAQLVLEDHFFHSIKHPLGYLNRDAIPFQPIWVKKIENPFIPEVNLPVIFGNKEFFLSQNFIHCGADILASTFFMLTRWEEFVLDERDEHGRFPASASYAWRNKFLNRPVVNEYAEMLFNMLQHLGYPGNRKQIKPEVLITHDVDIPLLWPSFSFFLKKLTGDIVKRMSLPDVFYSIRSFLTTQLKIRKDPYDTFDKLMALSERYKFKSNFFFLSEGRSKFDNSFPLDSSFIKTLIKRIQKRGHLIGFHPGYDTPTNSTEFKRQLSKLNRAVNNPVNGGRQHFLRFDIPSTWQIWEDNGLKWDASLSYPEATGFRCGTCTPFTVFNFLTREQLSLKEYPLTAMDITWTAYLNYSSAEILSDVDLLLNKINKYGGVFVLLWHNSSFNVPNFQKYAGVYEKILDKISFIQSQA